MVKRLGRMGDVSARRAAHPPHIRQRPLTGYPQGRRLADIPGYPAPPRYIPYPVPLTPGLIKTVSIHTRCGVLAVGLRFHRMHVRLLQVKFRLHVVRRAACRIM